MLTIPGTFVAISLILLTILFVVLFTMKAKRIEKIICAILVLSYFGVLLFIFAHFQAQNDRMERLHLIQMHTLNQTIQQQREIP